MGCPVHAENVCVYDSSEVTLNGQYDSKLYPNDYDGWKKDNIYLLYRHHSWHIGTIDLSQIYASCQSSSTLSSPYNSSACDNQWIVGNRQTFYTLKIWPSTCEEVPTHSPSNEPTTHSPTMIPTHLPTQTPSHIPTLDPTEQPSHINTNKFDATISSTVFSTDASETIETMLFIPSSALINRVQ